MAAELAGLHPHTLRIYERDGLLDPARSAGGTRRYSRRDIDRLAEICALTADGLNLAGIRRPGRFDEAELLAWAAVAIGEPAARPKRIYPVGAIPVTEVGKQFKPALTADAAVRAVTEALVAARLADAQTTATHEDGRLVVTVTGADPGRVRDAVAGFALTVRSGPSPAPQTAAK